MPLDDWTVERVLGSHQPLLKAVLEVLKPASAVECGCGFHSTPHLARAVSKLHVIEHNRGWANQTRKRLPAGVHCDWTVRWVSVKSGDTYDDVDPAVLRDVRAFYESVASAFSPFDLLFIDTDSACRVAATEALSPKARWILIHDLHPYRRHVYRWDLLKATLDPWHKYLYRPEGMIDWVDQTRKGVQAGKLDIGWTGFCSREPLTAVQLEEINVASVPESMRLWNQAVKLEELWWDEC